jgi:sigma-B regulation protein RsbU (phosphoserine phosphatase)
MDPAVVLAEVNKLLVANTPEEMFATAACVVLDPREGSATDAAAGHPPPLLWDQRRRRVSPLGCQGVALGLLPEWSGITEQWQLAPGDALLLYTDGVLDAMLVEKQRIGEERLSKLLGRTPPLHAEEWIGRLRSALDNCMAWPDDLTAVAVVRRSANG